MLSATRAGLTRALSFCPLWCITPPITRCFLSALSSPPPLFPSPSFHLLSFRSACACADVDVGVVANRRITIYLYLYQLQLRHVVSWSAFAWTTRFHAEDCVWKKFKKKQKNKNTELQQQSKPLLRFWRLFNSKNLIPVKDILTLIIMWVELESFSETLKSLAVDLSPNIPDSDSSSTFTHTSEAGWRFTDVSNSN